MRLALTMAVILTAAGSAKAAEDSMAGWYLAMVRPDGTPAVNSSPFGSEAACRQQLALMRSIDPDVLGQCVDLEPPR